MNSAAALLRSLAFLASVSLLAGCSSVQPLDAAQRARIRTVSISAAVDKVGPFSNPVGENSPTAYHTLQHGALAAELNRPVRLQSSGIDYDAILQDAGVEVDQLVRREFADAVRRQRAFGVVESTGRGRGAGDARFELKILGYGYSAASSLQWRVRPFVAMEARLVAPDGALLARAAGDGYDMSRPAQPPETYLADTALLATDLGKAARLASEQLLKAMLPRR